jgi:putative tricarboxylic transport membrane protein
LLLAFGLLGFVMRRYGWPVAPAIVGLILGPVAETNLRRALAIGEGDVGVLFASVFSKLALVLALLAVVGPPLLRLVRRRRTPSEVGS